MRATSLPRPPRTSPTASRWPSWARSRPGDPRPDRGAGARDRLVADLGDRLSVDRFGNVATNIRRAHIDAIGLVDGDRVEVRIVLDRYYAVVAGTFADAASGELILYEDSYGLVTLAISRGDAARLTGAAVGDELRIVRRMTPRPALRAARDERRRPRSRRSGGFSGGR